ncbi:MAG: peptide chain release factor-like protein [Kiritimatiellaeota bacterium]|nr:peptide chain release factor-like protein [Kiritimatiellota bacterium]
MSCELRKPGRDRVLSLSDAELLAECREDRARGSGRGGQKRNATDSAVRLTHLPTGLQAKSDATRSQAQNRRSALRRLRRTVAFEWRQGPPAEWPFSGVPGRRDRRYPQWAAAVLDVLEAADYRARDAAAFMGLGTGRLVRLLAADAALWQRVNQGRRRHDLPPLRKPQ